MEGLSDAEGSSAPAEGWAGPLEPDAVGGGIMMHMGIGERSARIRQNARPKSSAAFGSCAAAEPG